MKTFLTILIFFILFIKVTFPQPNFGMTGGMNESNITESGSSPRTGYELGFFMENSGNGFGLRYEILYSNKGNTSSRIVSLNGENVKIDFEYQFDYLEIPFCFKYKFDTGENSGLYLMFGGYLGYLLNSNVQTTGDFESEGTQVDANNPENYSVDVGLVLGGGINLANFSFNFTYSVGLVNVNKQDDMKNNCLSILVGIPF